MGKRRFDIVSFYELSEAQQVEALDLYDDAEENNYCANESETFYCLSDFMIPNRPGRYDGLMGISNTCGAGLILSQDNNSCLIKLIY